MFTIVGTELIKTIIFISVSFTALIVSIILFIRFIVDVISDIKNGLFKLAPSNFIPIGLIFIVFSIGISLCVCGFLEAIGVLNIV